MLLFMRLIHLMLDLIHSWNELSPPHHNWIDCDVSNIINKLIHIHSGTYSLALTHDVATFLKQLASDSGYVVTTILDGDTCPQSKHNAFDRRYKATMSQIDSYFCYQSAMKLASK